MSSSYKIHVETTLCVGKYIFEGHRSPCSCPSQLAKNIYFECRYLISMQKYLPCSRTSRSNCCESAAVCCCAHMRGNWVTVSGHHNTICCPLCTYCTLGGRGPGLVCPQHCPSSANITTESLLSSHYLQSH